MAGINKNEVRSFTRFAYSNLNDIYKGVAKTLQTSKMKIFPKIVRG